MKKTYTERCSCNAELVMQWDLSPLDLPLVKDWRENHLHEFAPVEAVPEGPPYIFESQGAAVERSWMPESDARPTVSLGFTRNEARR